MWMKLIYPRWPKLAEQTEFHLPPHGPVVFAAEVPAEVELTFVDENREELDLGDMPGLVALSVMLTCQVPRAKEIAAAYRRRGVPVIAGGIAVMLHAKEMAASCDAVFLGEVEGHLATVLSDLRTGSLRRTYDFMGALPPLDRVGPARRSILNYEHYTYRGVRMVDLVHASRGCRFNCFPCAVAFLGGRHFRPRPVEAVVAEIESIDNNRLFFVDNSLAQDSAWERELFRAIAPLQRKWVAHPIEQDDEILSLAYKAGCWYVYQAVVDTSAEIRERIRRYKDHGIAVEGTILLGTDDQDEDYIRRLVDFLLEIKLDMAEFTILTPFPHTPIRKTFEAEGRILTDDWSRYTCDQVVFAPKRLSASRLQDLYHYAWETFYGPGGREVKMGELYRKVLEREMEDGTIRRFQSRNRKVAPIRRLGSEVDGL